MEVPFSHFEDYDKFTDLSPKKNKKKLIFSILAPTIRTLVEVHTTTFVYILRIK